MKVSMSWLKEFVDLDISVEKLSEGFTLSGTKVESVIRPMEGITGVLVGKIVEIEPHPHADKLKICRVDIGSEILCIVTGAKNISEQDVVPVATIGANLAEHVRIEKTSLRGVESFGMLCSYVELGLQKEDVEDADENGIWILPTNLKLGLTIQEALHLTDVVLEFEITPNRADCLSVEGIAREASVFLKKAFKPKAITYRETKEKTADYVHVSIQDTTCSRYLGRVVKNVKVGESPLWLKQKLKSVGIRSINNIVDITNYVCHEVGQPMHAFDLQKLEGSEIIVRKAKEGEVLETLDEKVRDLNATMTVIADAKKPVALAGVMGGQATKVTEETKTILFEAACFNGASIRTTAKQVALRTDSSARFEKGLPFENVQAGMDLALTLVEMLGVGEICEGACDVFEKTPARREISFEPEKINAFLGTQISEQMMRTMFEGLAFQWNEASKTLIPPYFRRDVQNMQDLAEEVARCFDYNNIEPTLLSGKTSMQGRRTKEQKIAQMVKQIMISCGMMEAYTYSFMSEKVLDKLRIPQNSVLRNVVQIQNPLGEDFRYMRTTTLASILGSLGVNFSRRNLSAKLFECARVYRANEHENNSIEEEMLTIGMYGEVDFYDLKGVVETVFTRLHIKNVAFLPETNNPTYHPGRCAKVLMDNREVGTIGQVHPEVAKDFSCPEKTYLATIPMQVFYQHANLEQNSQPLPKYPAMSRDIALLLKEDIWVKQIETIILEKGTEILEHCELFDVYRGDQVAKGMKSVAYKITFRSQERTLTDEEVNHAMNRMIEALKMELGAELR